MHNLKRRNVLLSCINVNHPDTAFLLKVCLNVFSQTHNLSPLTLLYQKNDCYVETMLHYAVETMLHYADTCRL